MLFKLDFHYKPEVLYTYDTAISRNEIFTMEDSINEHSVYNAVYDLVAKYWGEGKMDNKITMVFSDKQGTKLYLTYWDNTLRVGTDIHFLADTVQPYNSYRVVKPLNKY